MKIKQISQNEDKFTHKGYNFIIEEDRLGVYGMGRAVRLYKLDGLKKEFVKCIGWTKTDNHGGGNRDNGVLLNGIVTVEECKTESVKYLNDLLS